MRTTALHRKATTSLSEGDPPMKAIKTLAISLACLCGSASVMAGNWTPARTLEGPFAVSSPPTAPAVVMNDNGHALLAWNATGVVRYAERLKGAAWQPTRAVPGAGAGAGPVAVAIGNNEVVAIAWTTAATRYVPSKLMVSLRLPGAAFGVAAEVASGTGVFELRLGMACDGGVTLLWNDPAGVYSSSLAGLGTGGTGNVAACNGQPGNGPWAAPEQLSGNHPGAGLPDLAVNDAGAALAVWQAGASGNPSVISAALRPAGGIWSPAVPVSSPTGLATWNPKPALDGAGNAAVGYLDGNRMVVAQRPLDGVWGTPVTVSGTQNVYYPALAMSAAGDLLAAWLTLDASNTGAVWQSSAIAGAAWLTPTRLSAASESADWPSAALAADGSVAVVGWVNDASNSARAAVRTGSTWTRSTLGAGWWGGTVPVAAGGGAAAAAFAQPNAGNPNSVRLMGRTWQ
jgi:hypothetical protein